MKANPHFGEPEVEHVEYLIEHSAVADPLVAMRIRLCAIMRFLSLKRTSHNRVP